MLQWKWNSSSKESAAFLGFLDFLDLLHNERFHAGKFLLKAAREVVGPVLEKNDKGKSQNDE
jgi:hypothetical protein